MNEKYKVGDRIRVISAEHNKALIGEQAVIMRIGEFEKDGTQQYYVTPDNPDIWMPAAVKEVIAQLKKTAEILKTMGTIEGSEVQSAAVVREDVIELVSRYDGNTIVDWSNIPGGKPDGKVQNR